MCVSCPQVPAPTSTSHPDEEEELLPDLDSMHVVHPWAVGPDAHRMQVTAALSLASVGDALDAQLPYRTRRPFGSHPLASSQERGADPRAIIDPAPELPVPPSPRREPTVQPFVVPAVGQAQNPSTHTPAEDRPALHRQTMPRFFHVPLQAL